MGILGRSTDFRIWADECMLSLTPETGGSDGRARTGVADFLGESSGGGGGPGAGRMHGHFACGARLSGWVCRVSAGSRPAGDFRAVSTSSAAAHDPDLFLLQQLGASSSLSIRPT